MSRPLTQQQKTVLGVGVVVAAAVAGIVALRNRSRRGGRKERGHAGTLTTAKAVGSSVGAGEAGDVDQSGQKGVSLGMDQSGAVGTGISMDAEAWEEPVVVSAVSMAKHVAVLLNEEEREEYERIEKEVAQSKEGEEQWFGASLLGAQFWGERGNAELALSHVNRTVLQQVRAQAELETLPLVTVTNIVASNYVSMAEFEACVLVCQDTLGELEELVANLDEYEALDRHDIMAEILSAMWKYAYALYKLEHFVEARTVLQQAVELLEHSATSLETREVYEPMLLCELGKVMVAQQEPVLALSCFLHSKHFFALAVSAERHDVLSNMVEVHMHLATLLFAFGAFEQALVEAQSAMVLLPSERDGQANEQESTEVQLGMPAVLRLRALQLASHVGLDDLKSGQLMALHKEVGALRHQQQQRGMVHVGGSQGAKVEQVVLVEMKVALAWCDRYLAMAERELGMEEMGLARLQEAYTSLSDCNEHWEAQQLQAALMLDLTECSEEPEVMELLRNEEVEQLCLHEKVAALQLRSHACSFETGKDMQLLEVLSDEVLPRVLSLPSTIGQRLMRQQLAVLDETCTRLGNGTTAISWLDKARKSDTLSEYERAAAAKWCALLHVEAGVQVLDDQRARNDERSLHDELHNEESIQREQTQLRQMHSMRAALLAFEQAFLRDITM